MISLLISDRLRERGWTKTRLAQETGIRPTTIGNLCNGHSDRIKLEHLDLICGVLECDICDILSRSPTRVQEMFKKDANVQEKLAKVTKS